jgi:hypothetical protein
VKKYRRKSAEQNVTEEWYSAGRSRIAHNKDYYMEIPNKTMVNIRRKDLHEVGCTRIWALGNTSLDMGPKRARPRERH